ncbi:Fucoxanthin-chlorophyll a-c binding protein F [Durusdinium trenchii]|uniref:Chloroplastic n=1 Tax=Durusdinium trenchii TaxID=1381693 RepID=A0ABP0RAS1_9DINO
MSDEKDGNGGAWARVPTWRGFKREMDWWCSALDLASTTKYNLAARWLLRQSGVNVAGKLSADKMLVGALDSACNRTCTGTEWLNNYLRCLRDAPEEVRGLVKSHKEYETFKFGNGRDFLEAIGADMHFAHRTLRCEHLTGKPIALKQLAAGASMEPEGTTDRNSSNLLGGESANMEVKVGRWKRMYLKNCLEKNLFTMSNLAECRHLRNRIEEKVKPMIEILKNKKPAVSPAKANTAEEISASSSSPPARLFHDNPKKLAVQQQEMRAMMEQMSRELALLRSQVTPEMEVDLSSEPSLIPDSPQDASPVNFTEAEIRELNGQAYEELHGANLTAQFGDDIPAEVTQEIRLGLRDGALQNESQPKNVLISKNVKPPDKERRDHAGIYPKPLARADLPPVKPEELVQVAQQAAPIPSMVGSSALPSRRISDVTGMGPAPGSPVPELIRRAGTAGGLLARQIAQARDLAEESGGMKRPAEVDMEALAEQSAFDGARSSPSAPSGVNESLVMAFEKGEDELMKQLQHGKEHPLRVIASLADIDKQQPLDAKVKDHGSWGGRWDLPSRSEWQLHQKLGWSWPTGSHDLEALLASAAHKELFWKNMSPEEKIAFREAANSPWPSQKQFESGSA